MRSKKNDGDCCINCIFNKNVRIFNIIQCFLRRRGISETNSHRFHCRWLKSVCVFKMWSISKWLLASSATRANEVVNNNWTKLWPIRKGVSKWRPVWGPPSVGRRWRHWARLAVLWAIRTRMPTSTLIRTLPWPTRSMSASSLPLPDCGKHRPSGRSSRPVRRPRRHLHRPVVKHQLKRTWWWSRRIRTPVSTTPSTWKRDQVQQHQQQQRCQRQHRSTDRVTKGRLTSRCLLHHHLHHLPNRQELSAETVPVEFSNRCSNSSSNSSSSSSSNRLRRQRRPIWANRHFRCSRRLRSRRTTLSRRCSRRRSIGGFYAGRWPL